MGQDHSHAILLSHCCVARGTGLWSWCNFQSHTNVRIIDLSLKHKNNENMSLERQTQVLTMYSIDKIIVRFMNRYCRIRTYLKLIKNYTCVNFAIFLVRFHSLFNYLRRSLFAAISYCIFQTRYGEDVRFVLWHFCKFRTRAGDFAIVVEHSTFVNSEMISCSTRAVLAH